MTPDTTNQDASKNPRPPATQSEETPGKTQQELDRELKSLKQDAEKELDALKSGAKMLQRILLL